MNCVALRGSSVAIWLALVAAGASPAHADRLELGTLTGWGHPSGNSYPTIRGLAYDGRYYYIADTMDHFIDKRPRDNTGRIYIYDRDGRLVKRIPEVPPVRGEFFPHGVATDGTSLWTTDYFGGNVYEYDIASGALKRTFRSPIAQPVRMDYQASTRTLWMTGYGDPRIYRVSLGGAIVSSFETSGVGTDVSPALDGRGGVWAANSSAEGSRNLVRHAADGTLLQRYVSPGFTSIATNLNDRTRGYVRDLRPAFNAERGQWEARLQHVVVSTIGGVTVGVDDLAVRCENLTTAQVASAHVGAPARWNCEDGGLSVSPGDAVRIEVTGTVR